MDYVVENWFDYEINGKIPMSLLESQFNEEYNNFEKMMNAIDVCTESGAVVLEISGAKIKEKLIATLEKFREWIRGIIKMLKDKIQSIKGDEAKKAKSNLDKITKMESVNVDAKISRIKINGKEKDHVDLLTNANHLSTEAESDRIEENNIDGWSAASPDKVVVEKVDDIIVKEAPMSGKEYADIVKKQIDDMVEQNSTMIHIVEHYEKKITEHINDINNASEEIMMVANPNSDDSNTMVKEKKHNIRFYKTKILDYKYEIVICKELSKFISIELSRIFRDTNRILGKEESDNK